jgi:hypothetical protein
VALSQAYIDRNNEIAARQLILASYRLVKVIKLVFDTSSDEYSPFSPAFLN